ncbi:Thioredoxin-like protein [Mycena venus]|uniref:Thioredoxin-like protein n=1 Tax=Mycena venus TaxID=2733690 RepID=A0A8H6TVV9_9AGAR|nr:Thioredoxin-like protein [Mycena venus]
MIVVHHLDDSRSQRILWLLVSIGQRFPGTAFICFWQEELGVPFQVKRYQRNSVGRAPKSLLEVTPLGKSPVITDGDVTLAKARPSSVEAHLEKVEWFAGGSGPTTADFCDVLPFGMSHDLKMAGPRCLAYVAKIQARPAYSRALEKGESRYAYKL